MVGFGTMGPGLAAAQLEERKKRKGEDGPGKRRGSPMLAIFNIFPMLIIPVVIYNLIAFLFKEKPQELAESAGPGSAKVEAMIATMDNQVFAPMMVSGAEWVLNVGHLLILLGLLFLFVEILRSTSTGTSTIMNHAVSMILFIVCLVEFLLIPEFATSVFFILTMMALLDVLAGVVVTIVSARRDFAVGEGFGG